MCQRQRPNGMHVKWLINTVLRLLIKPTQLVDPMDIIVLQSWDLDIPHLQPRKVPIYSFNYKNYRDYLCKNEREAKRIKNQTAY